MSLMEYGIRMDSSGKQDAHTSYIISSSNGMYSNVKLPQASVKQFHKTVLVMFCLRHNGF